MSNEKERQDRARYLHTIDVFLFLISSCHSRPQLVVHLRSQRNVLTNSGDFREPYFIYFHGIFYRPRAEWKEVLGKVRVVNG